MSLEALSPRVACKQLREEVAEKLDDIFVHQLNRSLPSVGEIFGH